MLTDQHPITPPPELVQQWRRNWTHAHGEFGFYLATQAARWGADQELEACVKWMLIHLHAGSNLSRQLRAWRRPEPPSLAEQARAKLDEAVMRGDCISTTTAMPILRAALERLQELEKGNE